MLQHDAQRRMGQHQQVVVVSPLAHTNLVVTTAANQSPLHNYFTSSPAVNSGDISNVTQQPPSLASQCPTPGSAAPPTPSPSPGGLICSHTSNQQQQQQLPLQPAYNFQKTQQFPASLPLTPVYSPSPSMNKLMAKQQTPVVKAPIQTKARQMKHKDKNKKVRAREGEVKPRKCLLNLADIMRSAGIDDDCVDMMEESEVPVQIEQTVTSNLIVQLQTPRSGQVCIHFPQLSISLYVILF